MQDSLENFGAYRRAMELFDLAVEDMEGLRDHSVCRRLVPQQLASADSVAANIEEGYGRGSRREYIQFLRFARGSLRETRGRYLRMRHWLPDELVAVRTALCDEIIGILNATIRTLRRQDGG